MSLIANDLEPFIVLENDYNEEECQYYVVYKLLNKENSYDEHVRYFNTEDEVDEFIDHMQNWDDEDDEFEDEDDLEEDEDEE